MGSGGIEGRRNKRTTIATSDENNPFRSPTVGPAEQERPPYPKRILAAQICGALISLSFFVESYIFPRREVPWPYIVFWVGVVTLIATLSLTIRSKVAAVVVLVYFEIIAFLAATAFYNNQEGPPSFLLIDAALSIPIIIILMQKSTQAYYDR